MLVMDAHDLLDGSRCLDSVVVWDSGSVVVENMGGNDMVEEVLFNKTNIAVNGTSCSADESPHLWVVVRKTTVGVVEVGNCHYLLLTPKLME